MGLDSPAKYLIRKNSGFFMWGLHYIWFYFPTVLDFYNSKASIEGVFEPANPRNTPKLYNISQKNS